MHTPFGGKTKSYLCKSKIQLKNFVLKGNFKLFFFYNFQRVGRYPIKDYVDMQFSHDYILTKHSLQN